MREKLYQKKIAIVYDWFDKWGGVERVLLVLREIFPKAVFFTSYFNEENASWAKNFDIKTSFIQKFPYFIKKNRLLSLPFYPLAFESFDFSQFDLVISVTSSFAKGIITKPNTFHICYLLTPIRYLWVMPQNYQLKGIKTWLISPYLSYLKKWDKIASQRPDKIISISKTVADRCQKYYQRKSEVVYPPFDIEYWKKIKSTIITKKYLNDEIKKIITSKYFLVVSRLEPYKKVDLAIRAFLKLKKKNKKFGNFCLVIVGEGSQKLKLKKIFQENIFFLSKISDIHLGYLYYYAYSHIIPQEEDFGYTALEAQFFNCPIIAYNRGGVKETVISNQTGIFFGSQNEEALILALERFHTISYNLKRRLVKIGEKYLEKYSKKKFIDKFLKILQIKLNCQ